MRGCCAASRAKYSRYAGRCRTALRGRAWGLSPAQRPVRPAALADGASRRPRPGRSLKVVVPVVQVLHEVLHFRRRELLLGRATATFDLMLELVQRTDHPVRTRVHARIVTAGTVRLQQT